MRGITMSDEEMRGTLSPAEQAILSEMLPKTMIPFRVTVSGHGFMQKQISILALDDVPAAALSIKVNVVKRGGAQ